MKSRYKSSSLSRLMRFATPALFFMMLVLEKTETAKTSQASQHAFVPSILEQLTFDNDDPQFLLEHYKNRLRQPDYNPSEPYGPPDLLVNMLILNKKTNILINYFKQLIVAPDIYLEHILQKLGMYSDYHNPKSEYYKNPQAFLTPSQVQDFQTAFKILLDKGANPNLEIETIYDGELYPILDFTILYNAPELTKMLIDADAAHDHFKFSPSFHAISPYAVAIDRMNMKFFELVAKRKTDYLKATDLFDSRAGKYEPYSLLMFIHNSLTLLMKEISGERIGFLEEFLKSPHTKEIVILFRTYYPDIVKKIENYIAPRRPAPAKIKKVKEKNTPIETRIPESITSEIKKGNVSFNKVRMLWIVTAIFTAVAAGAGVGSIKIMINSISKRNKERELKEKEAANKLLIEETKQALKEAKQRKIQLLAEQKRLSSQSQEETTTENSSNTIQVTAATETSAEKKKKEEHTQVKKYTEADKIKEAIAHRNAIKQLEKQEKKLKKQSNQNKVESKQTQEDKPLPNSSQPTNQISATSSTTKVLVEFAFIPENYNIESAVVEKKSEEKKVNVLDDELANRLSREYLDAACKNIILINRICEFKADDADLQLDPEVKHYALLYNIFRCFEMLRSYEEVQNRKANPNLNSKLGDLPTKDLRHLIRHYGIITTQTKDDVINFAKDLLQNLPNKLLNLKKDLEWKSELDPKTRKMICDEFGIIDDNKFQHGNNTLVPHLTNTKLYSKLKAFMYGQDGNEEKDTSELREEDAKIVKNTLIPQLKNLVNRIDDVSKEKRGSNPNGFTKQYLTDLQAMRFIIMMSCEYRKFTLGALNKFLGTQSSVAVEVAHKKDLQYPVDFFNELSLALDKYENSHNRRRNESIFHSLNNNTNNNTNNINTNTLSL